MRRALIVVSVLVLGCGGSNAKAEEPEPMSNRQIEAAPPAEESTVAAMERLTREMCACATSDCAKLVSERVTLWSQELMKKRGDKERPKISEAEQQRYTEIGTRMGECMMKAMGTGTP